MFEVMVRLNPATPSMVRTGGAPELTVADIAGACAGANELGLDIILAKIAGSHQSRSDLHDQLLVIIEDIATREKWKIRRREDRIRFMVTLLLFEYINEPRCPVCSGTKYVKAKPCKQCGANGYLNVTDKLRAQILEVDGSTYNRVWKNRYARIVEVLNAHEYDAFHSIRRLLR